MKYILIVDDALDLAETLKVRIEASGDFEVKIVQNGEEAVESVQKRAPDFIVVDVLMPKMDGLTTLKEINKISEKRIPFIVTTGKAVMMKDAFELEGACDFLTKPIDGNYLVKRIKEILGS